MENHTVHGRQLEIISKTVPEYLLEKAKEHEQNGKSTYTIDGTSGESFTFKQFQDLSRNVASGLWKRGLRKGDTVAYMLRDVVKLHIVLTGIWRANGVARAMYTEELEDSVLEIVNESKVNWLYCESDFVEICLSVAKRVSWKIQIITVDRVQGYESIYDLFEDDGKECPEIQIGPEDVALIAPTSGTTGRSKGAIYLHRNFVNQVELSRYSMPAHRTKPNFILGKAPHISGLSVPTFLLADGLIALVLPQLTNDALLHAVKTYKPGFIFGFPTFLITLITGENLNASERSCIECIMTSGTTIDPSLEFQLKQNLPNLKHFGIAFGATECAPISTPFEKLKLSDNISKFIDYPPLSMGKLCPGTSVQIREHNEGKVLGPNTEGEICIKSIGMFSHYLNQPEESKSAFTSDGYFRTGDTGYLDDNGFIFHVGRYKEMFKCAGNHVYPSQIDEVIFKHPAVQNVCTIGIDVSTGGGGEKIPRAFVTLKPGISATSEEILIFAHKNLPTYKHLKGGLFIVAELPKGATGKITRQLVAKFCNPSVQ